MGILRVLQISFVNFFDFSNSAAFLEGPKTDIEYSSKILVNPSVNGISGPITTRSILFSWQKLIIRE